MSNPKLTIAFDLLFTPQEDSQTHFNAVALFDEKYPAEAWMAIALTALRAAREKLNFKSCDCETCRLHLARVERSLKVFDCYAIDDIGDRRHAH